MIRKPWPIIIVSFIFFLIPFFNIGITYFILETKLSFFAYIYNLIFNSQIRLFFLTMVAPSLISSYAIYSVKKWSYPVFLLCMIWITIFIFFQFSTNDSLGEFVLAVLLPMLINILYVTYLLLPQLRAPYYNQRLRWWETKPRFIYSTNLTIYYNQELINGKLINISEGGLFADISSLLEPATTIQLNFDILETHFELKAKIVYRKPDGHSYGLQFVEVSKESRILLKDLMTKLAAEKFQEVRPTPRWSDDFIQWFSTLIKTGRGILPEIPEEKKGPSQKGPF